MRKGQRKPERRSQPRGWGNCWTLALPLWRRNPRFTYINIRDTRGARQRVPHVMYAQDISSVVVTETKPLTRVSGWPWWRVMLFSAFFHFRVRTGLGEESGFWPSERMFKNPRTKVKYKPAQWYIEWKVRQKLERKRK